MKKIRRRQCLSQPWYTGYDWLLISLVLGLTIFGLVMVANASVIEAQSDFGDKFHYARLQLQWAAAGLLLFGLFSRLDFNFFKKISLPFFVLSLLCLVAVLLPGISSRVWGARRWLDLGPIGFQPAELAKFALIVYLASFLEKKQPLLPFLIFLGTISFLIMLEPDLGTTVVIASVGLIVYFVAGGKILSLLALGILGILFAALLIFTSSYRRARLATLFNPSGDPLGASYHIHQVLLALGSGHLYGVGLGQSRQKYEYLPAVTTDSIFAVIAEELGFLGASALLLVFLVLIWRGFAIAQKTPNIFGQLLATGITSWIAVQALVNLGAMVALLPLTGMPLPFISYGGSSLISILAASGILVSISRCRS